MAKTITEEKVETSAAQVIRRSYKADHFSSQAEAERAYFRVLADSLARGRLISTLSNRLGNARQRTRELSGELELAKMELAHNEVSLTERTRVRQYRARKSEQRKNEEKQQQQPD